MMDYKNSQTLKTEKQMALAAEAFAARWEGGTRLREGRFAAVLDRIAHGGIWRGESQHLHTLRGAGEGGQDQLHRRAHTLNARPHRAEEQGQRPA